MDGEREVIRILNAKGNKDREIDFTDGVKNILRTYWKKYHPVNWLFYSRTRQSPLTKGCFQQAFTRAKLKSGVHKSGGIHGLGHIISTAAGAGAALTLIDADLITVDSGRADLGAVQNRFLSTISNLQNVVENTSAARSRIRDTDFALETSNLSKFQVLQQAGLSVLGQANATSQNILSLLQN